MRCDTDKDTCRARDSLSSFLLDVSIDRIKRREEGLPSSVKVIFATETSQCLGIDKVSNFLEGNSSCVVLEAHSAQRL